MYLYEAIIANFAFFDRVERRLKKFILKFIRFILLTENGFTATQLYVYSSVPQQYCTIVPMIMPIPRLSYDDYDVNAKTTTLASYFSYYY